MPREVVTVQVGQCGNQLGLRWWDLMLQELKANANYPDAMGSLFYEGGGGGGSGGGFGAEERGRPSRVGGSAKRAIDVAEAQHTLQNALSSGAIKARCVAVDTEEGVLKSILKSSLANVFDSQHFVSDVSGAGNNWAVGHLEYGDKYIDEISASVRAIVEKCDSLQTFVFLHSLSGGTGSGLGTRILGLLEDEYPAVFRFSSVVMPSDVEDVVTAPYNSCFSLRELIEHSDCVLPIDNDALATMAERSVSGGRRAPGAAASGGAFGAAPPVPRAGAAGSGYSVAKATDTKDLPYDTMNAIFAQMLSNLTCSMRYPGQLNMDINEITTNLVPYPRLHILTSSIAPLYASRQTLSGTKQLDAMFASCLDADHHLVRCDTRRSTYLAAALIARGPTVNVSDVSRNVAKVRQQMKMVYWNQDGFKSAICSAPPLGHQQSLLMLANNCAITGKIGRLRDKFMKLYSVRSHVHHYKAYLELDYFDATAEIINTTIDDYDYLAKVQPPKERPRSMRDFLV